MSRAGHYSVWVFAGRAKPVLVKSVGHFGSEQEASAWIEEKGYGTRRGDHEWALVITP